MALRPVSFAALHVLTSLVLSVFVLFSLGVRSKLASQTTPFPRALLKRILTFTNFEGAKGLQDFGAQNFGQTSSGFRDLRSAGGGSCVRCGVCKRLVLNTRTDFE